MSGALLYLTWCSLRNRLRRRVRRLREPRYLIGTIVGSLYFYFIFFRRRPVGGSGRAPQGFSSILERFRGTAELGGSLVMGVVTAFAWVLPRSGPVLTFTQSEVQWLFPSPVTRRELIRYKLLRSQLGVVLGSALMTLVFRPTSASGGWMFLVGMALLMTVLNLHLMGVALTKQRLAEHTAPGSAARWLPAFVVGAALLTLGTSVVLDWSRLAAMADGGAIIGELQRLSLTMPAAVVLWPFRAVARLPLSPTPGAFVQALPAALGLLVLNYWWVLRSDVAFEDAAAQAAEKTGQAAAAGASRPTPRARRGLTPFPLALTGRVETAILWKNLILLGRYASLTTLMRVVPVVIILGVVLSRASAGNGLSSAVAAVALWVAAFTLWLGPQMARNDLRQDLTQLAIIKTWPVRGAVLVRGEVAAPTVVLTIVIWVCLLVAVITAGALPGMTFGWSRWDITVFGAAAACVAPGILLVQLLAQNAMAVMFPAWVSLGSTRSRGVDVMGQRMLMMSAMLLVTIVGVLPAALAAGLTGFVLARVAGGIPVMLPAVAAAAVLLIEGVVISEAVGGVLDRTDISAVEIQET